MTDYEKNINLIPEHMRESVLAWIETGRPVGSFLTAVISNDLFVAIRRADDINRHALPDYMAYFFNYTPDGCWGSRKNVEKWHKRGGVKGKETP